MTRFEYIEALRKALEGLPPEVVARTVAEYEQRIHDASAAGQSEDEILAGLEDPQQVADKLHAELAPKPPAVTAAQGPASVFRMAASFVGLMVFNLFLIIPAIAYAGLLIAAFAVSLACYVGGIAMTGASVAGVNQFSLDEPFDHMSFHKPDAIADLRSHDGRTVVDIGEKGLHVEAGDKLIHIGPQPHVGNAETQAVAQADTASASASVSSSSMPGDATGTTIDIGPQSIIVKDGVPKDARTGHDEGDVDVDIPGLHIHDNDADFDKGSFTLGTDFFSESRPVQIGIGIAITMAGIISFLLCLVIARYTLLGIARLAQLEFGLLRGA